MLLLRKTEAGKVLRRVMDVKLFSVDKILLLMYNGITEDLKTRAAYGGNKMSGKNALRVLCFIFTVLFALLSFVACNGNKNEKNTEDESTAHQSGGEATQAPTDKEEIDDGINRIFADGEIVCRVIRAEKATDGEKDVYDALRDKINEITGKRPRLATDFLALGESYDPNEVAILVGKTGFEESSDVYADLGFGECVVKLVGRKLVVAFYDTDAAFAAVEKLGAALAAEYDGKSLAFDENVCIEHKSDKIISALPGYPDGNIAGVVDGGNGSMTAIIDETSFDAYGRYLSSLESENYTCYANKTIGQNNYATYVSDKYTVTAIHTPPTAQTRLTIDLLSENPLPAKEPEEFEKICDSSVTQMGVESTGRQNGMSYIIKLEDGSFMVFDGGDQRCIDLFMSTIESLADDKDNITVAAWVITHIHNDHAYMLRDLAKREELMQRITVERFIWNRPSDKQIVCVGSEPVEAEDMYQSMLKFEGSEIYTARAGQVYYVRNAVYTVYSTSEMIEPFDMPSFNDSCVVGLLEIDGRRLFFPGDSDRTQTKNLVRLYGEELKCDVLQVIHHGHNGGDTESYKLFDPITVLWPVGSYRYSQEWDGNLPFSQWQCNEWFFNENSSTENIYVAGKDIVTLIIKDLPTHADRASGAK